MDNSTEIKIEALIDETIHCIDSNYDVNMDVVLFILSYLTELGETTSSRFKKLYLKSIQP